MAKARKQIYQLNPKEPLPGFRRRGLLYKILGTAWYGLLILTILFEEAESSGGIPLQGIDRYAHNVAIASVFFFWTLYFANYRGVRDVFPVAKKENPLVNLARCASGGLLMFVPAIFFLVIYEIVFI